MERGGLRGGVPSPPLRMLAGCDGGSGGTRLLQTSARGVRAGQEYKPPIRRYRADPLRGSDGQSARELDEDLPVALQRVDLDVLLGSVMARAGRPELDRRDAAVEEEDGVRGAVPADRRRLA